MVRDDELRKAVRAAAEDLLTWPESFADAHVHFDDPALVDLVPQFSDIRWLRLAPVVAEFIASVDAPLLLYVPLIEGEGLPQLVDVDSLQDLLPWEPPSIHLLRAGSAFALRAVAPGRWFRDSAPKVVGALGWLSAYHDPADGVWRLALMYETQQETRTPG
jgi:hypothetical protein